MSIGVDNFSLGQEQRGAVRLEGLGRQKTNRGGFLGSVGSRLRCFWSEVSGCRVQEQVSLVAWCFEFGSGCRGRTLPLFSKILILVVG